MLFNDDFLTSAIVQGLSAKTFYDTFVLVGGTGCFVGLIIAATFLRKGCHEKNIAQLSVPFTLFNFCEIIVFALPIFLNPILLIPFILVPCVNFLISYHVIESGLITVTNMEISWMMPALLNGYKVSGGYSGVLLQISLIILNAVIYYPFLKFHSEQVQFDKAINKLGDKLNISESLRQNSEQNFIETQREADLSSKELSIVLSELSRGRLLLYYQPQICQKLFKVTGLEALLRLQKENGQIVGPYFLDTLIKHQQTDVIDFWVIEQAKRDLQYFEEQNYHPVISINLNPKLISDDTLIEFICNEFAQFPHQLKLEVVESSYLNNKEAVIKNINKLNDHTISTVIDDFGAGYSSLSMINDLPIAEVKLDKAFLNRTETTSGMAFYTHVVEFFQKLDKRLVAEGVETAHELALVQQLNVDTVQGWFYTKALPRNSVLNYINAHTIKKSP